VSKQDDISVIGNGLFARSKSKPYSPSLTVFAATRTNEQRIARIEQAYISTKHRLESQAHTCTADESGKCRYCSAVVIPALMPQGRTGELIK